MMKKGFLFAVFMLLLDGSRGSDSAAISDTDDADDVGADPYGEGEKSRASEVVVLTESTFEHDTQLSTGATTGDWFIEFYAPSVNTPL